MKYAEELVKELKQPNKKFPVQSPVLERGVPLGVLKNLTPNQIKRLEKQMKGGRI